MLTANTILNSFRHKTIDQSFSSSNYGDWTLLLVTDWRTASLSATGPLREIILEIKLSH